MNVDARRTGGPRPAGLRISGILLTCALLQLSLSQTPVWHGPDALGFSVYGLHFQAIGLVFLLAPALVALSWLGVDASRVEIAFGSLVGGLCFGLGLLWDGYHWAYDEYTTGLVLLGAVAFGVVGPALMALGGVVLWAAARALCSRVSRRVLASRARNG